MTTDPAAFRTEVLLSLQRALWDLVTPGLRAVSVRPTYYAKHVKGVVLGKNGRATVKEGGADMPELSSFAEYRREARDFMGGGAQPGVLERTRGTDTLRVDPRTGYFGVRSQDGTIRTFFRPDGDPLSYFWNQ